MATIYSKCVMCGGICSARAKTCSSKCHKAYMKKINAKLVNHEEVAIVTPEELTNMKNELRADSFVFGRHAKGK